MIIRSTITAAALLTTGLAGCQNTKQATKPATIEEIALPPAGDSRYSELTSYPDRGVPHRPRPKFEAGGGLQPAGGSMRGGPGGYGGPGF